MKRKTIIQNFYFVLFFLLGMSGIPEAQACIETESAADRVKIWIACAIGLSGCWFCLSALYFIVRGFIRYKRKNINGQNLKSFYLMPALIYSLFFGMIFLTGYYDRFDYVIHLYCFYAVYAVCCCGYQLRAYIKRLEPLKQAWIFPLTPLGVTLIAAAGRYAGSFLQTLKIEGKTAFLCSFLTLSAAVICGLYKVCKTTDPTVKKLFWGLLLISVGGFSAYILYTNYTYHPLYQDCL